jgi:Na+-transporting NADH:ubiquinone oxidoreductase subunit NqrD
MLDKPTISVVVIVDAVAVGLGVAAVVVVTAVVGSLVGVTVVNGVENGATVFPPPQPGNNIMSNRPRTKINTVSLDNSLFMITPRLEYY